MSDEKFVIPNEDPISWTTAKQQLHTLQVLPGFLSNKNQSEFDAWTLTLIRKHDPSFVLYLRKCWILYCMISVLFYRAHLILRFAAPLGSDEEFGPWGTCWGRVNIPKPDKP